ncbi:TetR/AcrR family transcriptional regulator [Prevotella dentasini JCM 15908]
MQNEFLRHYMYKGNAYREELKGKILQAATEMFYRLGIRQVTMDDIANGLKISKRTLYEIYENKEKLLSDVLLTNDEQNSRTLETFDVPGKNVLDIIIELYLFKTEKLSHVNPLFFEELHKYPKLIEFMRRRHDRQRKAFLDFIGRGISEGYFLPNVNYELLQIMGDATGEYVMNNFLYKKYDFRDIFHTSVLLFIRGICTPKGVQRLDELMEKLR